MTKSIERVAVIGSGTMGAGIAGLCAAAGTPVVLLDIDKSTAEEAIGRLTGGRKPVLTEEQSTLITAASLGGNDGSNDKNSEGLSKLADCDWICEVIIEDLKAKRDLFGKIEPHRKPGSIVTSNTSGIPLKDICEGMPAAFREQVAVTHFFNPVHIMRLLEIVPGEDTKQGTIDTLVAYLGNNIGKGVVYAKDTVNFIGNRIGCYWMLCGLHHGAAAQQNGLSMETIDALMSKPVGLPPTGLYGLVDLVGLDIMDHVAKNLRSNLPAGDDCAQYLDLPKAEESMIKNGQLGRKTGGGYYKMTKDAEGNKSMQVFNLDELTWRDMQTPAELDAEHAVAAKLLFAESVEGNFAWKVMSNTLAYAADLVPEIADDIVNVDRAMRWGFNWQQGPFEMIDEIGAEKFVARLKAEGRTIPAMLKVLEDSDYNTFYADSRFLDTSGNYQPMPGE